MIELKLCIGDSIIKVSLQLSPWQINWCVCLKPIQPSLMFPANDRSKTCKGVPLNFEPIRICYHK
jgi:hypothetical protein